MDLFKQDISNELDFFDASDSYGYQPFTMFRGKSKEDCYESSSFTEDSFPHLEFVKSERHALEFNLDGPSEGHEYLPTEIEDKYNTQDAQSSMDVEIDVPEHLDTDLHGITLSESQSLELDETQSIYSEIQPQIKETAPKIQSVRNPDEQIIYEKLINFFKYSCVSKADLPIKKVANLFSLQAIRERLFSHIILPILLDSPEKTANQDVAYLHKKRGDQFQKKFHSKWRDVVYYNKDFKIVGVTRDMAYERMRQHFQMSNNDAFDRIFGSKLKMGLENNAVETMLSKKILFEEYLNGNVVLSVVQQLHGQTESDIQTNFMGHVSHLLNPKLSDKEREAYVEEHLNRTRTVKKPFMYSENYKAAQAFVDKLQLRVSKTASIPNSAEKAQILKEIQMRIESEISRNGFATQKATGKGRKSKDLASFVRIV